MSLKVEMIIKSIFRRYERWNPVHPTYGAFWGMGVGIGCGIGWGPGFGPEVVGYVGAGCGTGFNVGFTLLGIGIGLPTNYLLTAPHNAFMATRRGILDVARAGLGNSMVVSHVERIADRLKSGGRSLFPWDKGVLKYFEHCYYFQHFQKKNKGSSL